MRIVHVLASTGWGGAERIASMLHGLAHGHGHDSSLEAMALPDLVRGLSAETRDRIPAAGDETKLLRWTLRARQRVAKVHPDLIHAHLATPGLASAVTWIAGSFPLVLTFHLLPEHERWPKDYLLRIRSRTFLHGLFRVRRQRTIVAVSESDRARLSNVFPRERVRAVQNVPPPPTPEAAGIPGAGWPENTLRLLSVGRLHRQKGFDRIVRALAAPDLKGLSWHWLVIGAGEQRAELEAETTRAGLSERVTFAGAQPSHRALSSADLVVCASRWEGMPLVPLEAVRAGTPAILSPIAPHLEFFSGIDGSFLPEDEQAWPAALKHLFADRTARERLRTAQAVLAPRLHPENLWEGYAAIYRDLLAR